MAHDKNPDGTMPSVFAYLPPDLKEWVENAAWEKRMRTSQYIRELIAAERDRQEAAQKQRGAS